MYVAFSGLCHLGPINKDLFLIISAKHLSNLSQVEKEIIAGSDFFLMPSRPGIRARDGEDTQGAGFFVGNSAESRYEPCGIPQMCRKPSSERHKNELRNREMQHLARNNLQAL